MGGPLQKVLRHGLRTGQEGHTVRIKHRGRGRDYTVVEVVERQMHAYLARDITICRVKKAPRYLSLYARRKGLRPLAWDRTWTSEFMRIDDEEWERIIWNASMYESTYASFWAPEVPGELTRERIDRALKEAQEADRILEADLRRGLVYRLSVEERLDLRSRVHGYFDLMLYGEVGQAACRTPVGDGTLGRRNR